MERRKLRDLLDHVETGCRWREMGAGGSALRADGGHTLGAISLQVARFWVEFRAATGGEAMSIELRSAKPENERRRDKRQAADAHSAGPHTGTRYDDDGDMIGEAEVIE
jgi:hypothetical protein